MMLFKELVVNCLVMLFSATLTVIIFLIMLLLINEPLSKDTKFFVGIAFMVLYIIIYITYNQLMMMENIKQIKKQLKGGNE